MMYDFLMEIKPFLNRFKTECLYAVEKLILNPFKTEKQIKTNKKIIFIRV